MHVMRVRGIGQAGVNKDTPSFELKPNEFTDALNVRFRQTSIEKFGGYVPVQTKNMPDVTPLSIVQRGSRNAQIYGTADSLYMIEGNEHRLVSKMVKDGDKEVPFKYDADPSHTWYYTLLSNSVVMNTENNDPQGMTPSDTTFKDLPGWGEPQGPDGVKMNWKCGRIRAFRNYLVALDMVEDGLDMPQRVRWSNVSYVNSLPPDWIETDETKDGGFNDLSDCTGRIVDGVPLRDSFVIYTDQETYLMDYVGGILIFQFRKLFSDSGVLAPECATEFEGQHFVIAQDDIFVHNGSTRTPIASGRIKDYLISEISSVNPAATKTFSVPTRKEIWVCYVGSGATVEGDGSGGWAYNKAAVWNWEYNNWTFYDLPYLFDLNMSLPPDPDQRQWNEFTVEGEDEWDAEKQLGERWTAYGKDFINRVIWSASQDKCFYLLDEGETINNYLGKDKDGKDNPYYSRPVFASLERTHLDMDEVVENTRQYKFITTLIPQFHGEGVITCSIGGSFNSTQTPEWTDVSRYDISEDVKVDCYCNNRYPSFKFVSDELGDWYFSGYDIEFKEAGNR